MYDTMPQSRLLTVGQAAKVLGCPGWAIRRVCDLGLIQPPLERVKLWRLIPPERLEEIREAIQKKGYVVDKRPEPEPETAGV